MLKNKRRFAGLLGLPVVLALAAVLLPGGTAQAAEVGCDSFTSVRHSGTGYYLHVPSLGSGSGNYNCVLVNGSNNVGVLALQESLNRCYGQGLRTDGIFGANTERAVRNAQTQINSQHGQVLSVDGRYGPRTSSYFRFQLYDHLNGGAHSGLCDRR